MFVYQHFSVTKSLPFPFTYLFNLYFIQWLIIFYSHWFGVQLPLVWPSGPLRLALVLVGPAAFISEHFLSFLHKML